MRKFSVLYLLPLPVFQKTPPSRIYAVVGVVCFSSAGKTPTTQRLVSALNPAVGEAIAQGRVQHQRRKLLL